MSKRVLIADDNAQILELIEAYLEPLPVEVTSAVNGEEAMDAIAASPPDLVLLDIMMPRRSGYEVCQQLKRDERYKHIPVVMVTALNEEGDVERAREAGADDYVTKPVNKAALLEILRKLLDLPDAS